MGSPPSHQQPHPSVIPLNTPSALLVSVIIIVHSDPDNIQCRTTLLYQLAYIQAFPKILSNIWVLSAQALPLHGPVFFNPGPQMPQLAAQQE